MHPPDVSKKSFDIILAGLLNFCKLAIPRVYVCVLQLADKERFCRGNGSGHMNKWSQTHHTSWENPIFVPSTCRTPHTPAVRPLNRDLKRHDDMALMADVDDMV
jgi:hypothetical protein